MTATEFIMHKRDGHEHDAQTFKVFFDDYVKNKTPDYQVAAWLMAAFLQGLSVQEKVWLTEAVIDSGDCLDLSHINKAKVDKHSTGGVGDKTSIVLLPLLASLDVVVPMMSGRGLGHTGGTLDKLEAIPDMQVQLPVEKYLETIEAFNGAFMAQTTNIAPLDKKLYSLRDVTATVESIPLITASIIGKKMTENLDGLVLDVKCGNGAFMKNYEDAQTLAQSLVETSQALGVKTCALITDMNEPLGQYVGNSVEILECIQMLQGQKVESRLDKVTMDLAVAMCQAAFPEDQRSDWSQILRRQLENGAAYECFQKIIHSQGVSQKTLSELPQALPIAKRRESIMASREGYVVKVDSYRIGRLLIELKAGRKQLADSIDPSVGLKLHVKYGSYVKRGDLLAELIAEADFPLEQFANCFEISTEQPAAQKIIKGVIK